VQFDQAARLRQPRLHQFRVMVSGIVQEDVIERMPGYIASELAAFTTSTSSTRVLPTIKIDGDVDVQFPPAALRDRHRDVLRCPAADSSRSRARGIRTLRRKGAAVLLSPEF
jgi:hypothetical protein